jgi:hypothetical protein
VVWPQNHSDGF